MESLWEDGLLERKVESDLKDLLKTLVAFANSVYPGHTAVILIGERDDGTVDGVQNPENIQMRVRHDCEKIYPSIVYRTSVYSKEEKNCVRVEIEYSGNQPHFGGPAWVRRGNASIKASEEIFQRLIATRTDVVRELSKWIGKPVTVWGDRGSVPEKFASVSHRWSDTHVEAILVDVNQHWITLGLKYGSKIRRSEPLSKLVLTFDHENDRLKIIVLY